MISSVPGFASSNLYKGHSAPVTPSTNFDALAHELGLSAAGFIHLADELGITPDELASWIDPNSVDPDTVDPQVAIEFKDRIEKVFAKIAENPLYLMYPLLIKSLDKTSSLVSKIFKTLEDNGKEVTSASKGILGQFETALGVADAIQPLTLGVDLFAFYKQILKANSEWNIVKASATGAKICSKALQWPELVAKVVGQFRSDLAPNIKASKELCGLNIAAQGLSLISGILTVAKQWGEAKKSIEVGEAALGTIGLVGNVIDMPAAIIKKLALISPAVETASKVATWAPWLGVVSAVLSTASLAASSCSMVKSMNYTKHLNRAKQEGIIKFLSLSQEHNLREGPVKEQFNDAVDFVEHHEAISVLKQMIADLDKANDKDLLTKTYESLKGNIELMKTSGSCARGIAALMESQNFLQDASVFVSDPSYRKSLKEVLSKEVVRMRGVKNSYDFTALMKLIQAEFKNVSAPLMEKLTKAGNEAYIDRVIATDDKTLEYHFNVSGSELKESLVKISQISKSNMSGDIAEGVNDIVNSLKNRVRQKIDGDLWTIVMNIVSLVATIILTIVAFGLSFSPLAPFAYALLVAVALASVGKIIYDYVQKNEFKERFGRIENKIYDLEAQRIEKEREKAQLELAEREKAAASKIDREKKESYNVNFQPTVHAKELAPMC